jgi:hypothetical protein
MEPRLKQRVRLAGLDTRGLQVDAKMPVQKLFG